jgi:hypothetical protein
LPLFHQMTEDEQAFILESIIELAGSSKP